MTICCDRSGSGFGRANALNLLALVSLRRNEALRAALSDHAPLIIDYDYVL
jgi:hypothetical protein